MISIPERTVPNTEYLYKMLDAHGADLRVASPGIIQSFDATTGKATIQLTTREKQNIDGVVQDVAIPELKDVLIGIPRGGGFLLTLPIKQGDECLVVFADACIDGWWQSGGIQNQMDNRRHDLSDSFFIPGVWSEPHNVTNYSSTAAEFRTEDGNTKLSLTDGTLTLIAGGHSIVINSSGVSIDNVLFLPHTHSGVQTGAGNTQGVVV